MPNRGLEALERAAFLSGTASELKGESLFRHLSSLVVDLLEVEIAGIMLYDAAGESPAGPGLVAQAPVVGLAPDAASLLAGYRIPLGQDSPALRYWEKAEPVAINDALSDPLVRELGLDDVAAQMGIRSTMLCGLQHEGSLLGLIQVCNKRDGSDFDREDMRLLSIFARQAAATLRNAQLLEEIQRYVDEAAALSSLYRMTSDLASLRLQPMDLKEMLAVVLQHLRQVLDYDSCLVFLATADGQALRVEAVDGAAAGVGAAGRPASAEGMLGIDTPVDAGINGWIFGQGQPLLIEDADLDPRRLHIKGRTEGIRAAVGAPLVADGQVIGTIYATREEPGSFSTMHLDFLSFTAVQVAASVQRARLLDRATRRAEEMETLLSIATVMASTLDPEQLLQAIYEQAGRVMDTSAFFVAIHDPDGDTIDFRLVYDRGRRLEPFSLSASESQGLTAYTIRTGQPLLIRNWEQEREDAPLSEMAPVVIGEPTLSWLAVPIIVQARILGAMGAQSYRAHAFTARQERLLAAIANQAGISLQNARLLADLKLVNTDLQEMVTAQAYLLQAIDTTTAALDAAEDLDDLRRQLQVGAGPGKTAGDD
ncbi:MAG: GAF domain-containing protein [Anaerolineae bacterium]